MSMYLPKIANIVLACIDSFIDNGHSCWKYVFFWFGMVKFVLYEKEDDSLWVFAEKQKEKSATMDSAMISTNKAQSAPTASATSTPTSDTPKGNNNDSSTSSTPSI